MLIFGLTDRKEVVIIGLGWADQGTADQGTVL